jgi:hypothetical protein
MKILMNVPGYVQDAQQEYITLLTRPDVKEIYILAPYFSDDKIVRALIVAANKMQVKLNKSGGEARPLMVLRMPQICKTIRGSM